MTVQPLFDTARFRDRLTSSGMPAEQARAVTEGFEEALRGATATTADLERQTARLDSKIDGVEQRLEAKMAAVEQRLDAKIDGVEQRLEAKIATVEQRLDAKIDGVEERLNARISLLDESIGRRLADSQATQLRWFVASLFGGLGLLFAALKLFP
jgi:DNA anti-recombination protein RmuC